MHRCFTGEALALLVILVTTAANVPLELRSRTYSGDTAYAARRVEHLAYRGRRTPPAGSRDSLLSSPPLRHRQRSHSPRIRPRQPLSPHRGSAPAEEGERLTEGHAISGAKPLGEGQPGPLAYEEEVGAFPAPENEDSGAFRSLLDHPPPESPCRLVLSWGPSL